LGISALAVGCADQTSETQETIDNLVQAGFAADDIRAVSRVVSAGHDAVVSLQASREMLETDGAALKEQYRTANVVGPNVSNICVNGAEFTGVFSTALNTAIARYNALGLQSRMTRTAGSTAGCSATNTAHVTASATNSSGFPANGVPFNAINISSQWMTAPPHTIGIVVIHELGHTIGIRHSDYFNRSISCGGAPTNEGDGGVGAILIPGTPAGATPSGSLFNTCSNANDVDQFTASDVTALTTLY